MPSKEHVLKEQRVSLNNECHVDPTYFILDYQAKLSVHEYIHAYV